MRMHLCLCVYVSMFLCMRSFPRVFLNKTCACMVLCLCMYASMFVCMFVCMHVCMHVCVRNVHSRLSTHIFKQNMLMYVCMCM